MGIGPICSMVWGNIAGGGGITFHQLSTLATADKDKGNWTWVRRGPLHGAPLNNPCNHLMIETWSASIAATEWSTHSGSILVNWGLSLYFFDLCYFYLTCKIPASKTNFKGIKYTVMSSTHIQCYSAQACGYFLTAGGTRRKARKARKQANQHGYNNCHCHKCRQQSSAGRHSRCNRSKMGWQSRHQFVFCVSTS